MSGVSSWQSLGEGGREGGREVSVCGMERRRWMDGRGVAHEGGREGGREG